MPRTRRLLDASEISGIWAILPTPAKPEASDWRAQDTVDLAEAARLVEALIASGVDGLLSLGTFGEGATVTWDEKRAFLATVAETVRGRVPFFGGTTALSTREVVRQTRAALDLGVDGTMLGPPMWCQADTPTAVQFYKDVAEACPEAAICVYANPEAFKFAFPRPFWAQVSRIRQVVSAKYLGIGFLAADLRLIGGRIRLLPTESNYYSAARVDPEQCTAFWSSGVLCGPAPAIALRDAVAEARRTNDWRRARDISDAIAVANARLFPNGDFAEFSKFNVGIEKLRIDAAGWCKAGPPRPPYHVIPPDYAAGAVAAGQAWAELHARLVAGG